MNKYITFDLGGTQTKHGLIQEDGIFLSKSAYPTERFNLDRFLQHMLQTIEEYRKNHDIQGIAISMPGYIDIYSGYSEMAGAIEALNGKNLKTLLNQQIDLPIEIENDGNCAAIAEHVSGHAKGCKHFICMTIGTGIGGGIFINGDIFRGSSFKGGEFGFTVTRLDGDRCENMHGHASTTALINTYKSYKNKTGHVDGQQLFEEIMQDEQVRQMFQEWVSHLCRGIYNLTVTLNPEKFLIGGGVSAQPQLMEEIHRQLKDYFKWDEFNIPVVPCKYRNDAGMIGAFYHFKKMQNISIGGARHDS